MKHQTAIQVVGLSLLGLFLLSVVGCGKGELTTLSKEEFEKKAMEMRPEEVVKWLGKPTRVTDDDGHSATWHYHNACYDKTRGMNCDAAILVLYNAELIGVARKGLSNPQPPPNPQPKVKSCIFPD